MKTWRLVLPLVALTVLAVVVAPGVAVETPEGLLAEARAVFESVTDLRARFEQTSQLAASGLETMAAGTVELARGGRMRWSYEGDDPQEIISDGETLWFYQVRDRTVLRRELASLPPASRLALDLLGGFVGIEVHFTLSTCGDRCLEMVPRQPQPDLSRLRVVIADGDRSVRSVSTADALGNRTRVEFSAVELDPGLGAARFRFVPPAGVQVLDMEAAEH